MKTVPSPHLHIGLRKVETMTTPNDVARMLRGVTVSSQQIQETSDARSYRSRSGRSGAGNDSRALFTTESTGFGTSLADELPETLAKSLRDYDRAPAMPSPAMMPKKRLDTESPMTFASLNAHELPVVREYSAGGLVFNARNEVAIIARHSRSGHLEWCLPKGHIEKGESPEQTAQREVHEETGILGEVFGSIATIDYWFTGEKQRVHKLVHHYVLRQVSGSLGVDGDPDREAENAAWVRFEDLTSVLSYPNERKIVWLYARKYRRL